MLDSVNYYCPRQAGYEFNFVLDNGQVARFSVGEKEFVGWERDLIL